MVLPAVPFGVQTGQRELPLCLNANPSTQALLLRDGPLRRSPAAPERAVPEQAVSEQAVSE